MEAPAPDAPLAAAVLSAEGRAGGSFVILPGFGLLLRNAAERLLPRPLVARADGPKVVENAWPRAGAGELHRPGGQGAGGGRGGRHRSGPYSTKAEVMNG